jgi:flagellar hook-length control protein FliK
VLISQIIAADTSSLQFANLRATETVSDTGSGFSAYLARIMNPQTQEVIDNQWQVEQQAPDDIVSYDNVPVSTAGSEPSHVAREPDRADPQGFNPGDDGRVTHGPKDQKPADDVSRVQPKESRGPESNESHARPAKAGADQTEHQVTTDKADKKARVDRAAGTKQQASAKADRSLNDLVAASSNEGEPQDTKLVSPETTDRDKQITTSETAPAVTTETLAADDSSPVARVAEIDVVLESSSGSASAGTKAAVIRDQERVAGKERKANQANAAVTASQRKDSEAQAEQLVAAGRKPRITVHDLRGRGSSEDKATDLSANGAKHGEGSVASQSTSPGSPGDSANSFSSLFGVKGGGQDGAVSRGADPGSNTKANPGVLNTLRQTLAENVNGEIVRTAHMVVRGSDTGEIRLNLKPETLGNVRIMLQMNDGHIAGQIIVENSSVREVFEQNLASLIKAFTESGLEAGALDVTVADSGDGNQTHSEGRRASQAIRELDRAVPLLQLLEDDHELVDLVV